MCPIRSHNTVTEEEEAFLLFSNLTLRHSELLTVEVVFSLVYTFLVGEIQIVGKNGQLSVHCS